MAKHLPSMCQALAFTLCVQFVTSLKTKYYYQKTHFWNYFIKDSITLELIVFELFGTESHLVTWMDHFLYKPG